MRYKDALVFDEGMPDHCRRSLAAFLAKHGEEETDWDQDGFADYVDCTEEEEDNQSINLFVYTIVDEDIGIWMANDVEVEPKARAWLKTQR